MPLLDIEHLPTREGYDRWAALYDDEQNPLVAIEEPLIDELLRDVRGLPIADLGCGTGRHSWRLAMAGAQVTALDFSEQMLSKARAKLAAFQKPAPEARPLQWSGDIQPVQFIQHDLSQPLPLADHSFDRVLCSLVLDHIENLPLLFAEMKRICKPSAPGPIVVSTMDPAMMLRGTQARFTDPVTGRETRPKSCPHQISDYVMAAMHAGLIFDHFSEQIADAKLAQRCPRAEKYLGWPILLLMQLRMA